MNKKTGRNTLCSCGSGKKAKNCCGIGKQRKPGGAGVLTSGWTILAFAGVCVLILGGVWYNTQSVDDPRLRPPVLPAGGGGTQQAIPGNTGLPARSILEKTSYTEIPGIDMKVLSKEHRENIMQRTNVEKCSCGCGFTIAGCRHLDTSCGVSLPMAKQIVTEITGS